ncbi:MAG: hypothetical protein ACXW2A_09915 [Burkholderiales bacterium]
MFGKLVAAGLMLASSCALAASSPDKPVYPDRPIRLIVGQAPGGIIGTALVGTAAPDGGAGGAS